LTSAGERDQRDVEAGARVDQGDQHRVVVIDAVAVSAAAALGALGVPGVLGRRHQRVDLVSGLLELRRLGLGREVAVTDVVDAAGERVHGRQRAALIARQQPDAVGEVPGLLPGDLLALLVRLFGVHRHLPFR